ncbi:MAG TPA: MmcQ/YjbR family DNA-binding protein [Mycobacteriales bacterium]|nr:MmcQ/YjbR family DNA-binding protein [Mycobacteriales bacterium]
MVTVEDVRALALTLPRTTEHLIHDRVKLRVGAIVYVAFSRDETQMGFAFPREERDELVAAEPSVYLLPRESDLRFNWVVARLAALDEDTMEERVVDAWAMCVPKFLSRQQRDRRHG